MAIYRGLLREFKTRISPLVLLKECRDNIVRRKLREFRHTRNILTCPRKTKSSVLLRGRSHGRSPCFTNKRSKTFLRPILQLNDYLTLATINPKMKRGTRLPYVGNRYYRPNSPEGVGGDKLESRG